MWPSRNAERQRIIGELNATKFPLGLNGLSNALVIDTLALQFVASLRREDYYRVVQNKPIAACRANPNHTSFDAERAVAFHMQQGNIDEAAWLIFLMTHFARRPDTAWLRLQDIYGRLGAGVWDWNTVAANPAVFHKWHVANWQKIRGNFGNHRKYESLRPGTRRSLMRVVDEYIDWVGPKGHKVFFANAVQVAGNDPRTIFDHLYTTLRVASFGRLAKFDYLSLIGRYHVAPIVAGSAYLDGATGPGRGARLLIDGHPTGATNNLVLQKTLNKLDARLNVGMAVMEDALCNWQKSPALFVHYKG